MEDIGMLIGRGFSTWKSNLTLGLPFLYSFILSMLVLVLVLAALAVSLVPLLGENVTALEDMQGMQKLQSLQDVKDIQDLLSRMQSALPGILLGSMLLILLLSLISAFFTAGAIGMALQALQTGRATTAAMWSAGKEHFWNMFLASLLMGLMTAASLVFLLPGLALLMQTLQPDPQAVGLLMVGLVLFILYALALSVALAAAPFALVVENLRPVQAIRTSLRFFNYNKFDVFILWLVVMALSIGLQMLGSSLSAAGGTSFQPISAVSGMVGLLVLSPLSAVWWTRLYLSRTGRLNDQEINQ
jgi:hypothetical protein